MGLIIVISWGGGFTRENLARLGELRAYFETVFYFLGMQYGSVTRWSMFPVSRSTDG